MSWLEWTIKYHGVISTGAAVMSAFVAVTLFMLAFFQHRWNQQHNKALVMPYLTGQLNGDIYSKISFSIVNKGLGPALVDKLEIRYCQDILNMSEFETLLKSRLPSFDVSVGEFNDQYAFSPDDRFSLVNVLIKSCASATELEKAGEELFSILGQISIHVDYHSLLDRSVISYVSKNNLSTLQNEYLKASRSMKAEIGRA